MSIKLDRRRLIATMGSAIALGYLTKRQLWDSLSTKKYKGKVYGANFKRGHHLLSKTLPKSDNFTEELDVAIVGTGVTGLSCAYHLYKDKRLNPKKVKLFELEDHIGGKSHAYDGPQHNTKAPWGAHYLPLPNKENTELLDFLRDIDILGPQFKSKNYHEGYSPYMLLNAPKERLYLYGRYQEGLIPKNGLTESEKGEFKKFFKLTNKLSQTKDAEGRFAFDIPMERSSKDKEFLDLDNITMVDFLHKNNLKGEPLIWYIDYCCRDDYGTSVENISAWAALHYFCSRRPYAPGVAEETVLTWPEGNNYLVQALRKKFDYEVKKAHLLQDIDNRTLHFYDFLNKRPQTYKAKKIVLALPQFIIAKIFNQQTNFSYGPWLVANIRVKWDEDIHNKFAWDNVNYKGVGLGFIVAKHQSLETMPKENILTYYRPLTHLPPWEARKWAIKRTHNQWAQDVIQDLSSMFYDLEERVMSMDFWTWGHAMISPTPGFIQNGRFNLVRKPHQNIIYAHSDLSGISLFEEAFYRGQQAAKEVLS